LLVVLLGGVLAQEVINNKMFRTNKFFMS